MKLLDWHDPLFRVIPGGGRQLWQIAAEVYQKLLVLELQAELKTRKMQDDIESADRS